ncbi:MAG: PA2169 family four-helix-bundle protein [Bacteroidota bacterium]
METIKEKGLDTLRELIIVNNDRFEGYKTAAKETNDASLNALFTEFSTQSKKFSDELRKLIPPHEEAPGNDETKIFGDLYRSWMGMKNALTENNNHAILLSCEFSEDIIRKTYDDFIMDPDVPEEVLALVSKQRSELDRSYDILRTKKKSI